MPACASCEDARKCDPVCFLSDLSLAPRYCSMVKASVAFGFRFAIPVLSLTVKSRKILFVIFRRVVVTNPVCATAIAIRNIPTAVGALLTCIAGKGVHRDGYNACRRDSFWCGCIFGIQILFQKVGGLFMRVRRLPRGQERFKPLRRSPAIVDVPLPCRTGVLWYGFLLSMCSFPELL